MDLRTEIRVKKKPKSIVALQWQACHQGLGAPWRVPILSLLTFTMFISILCALTLMQWLQHNLPHLNQRIARKHQPVLFLHAELNPEHTKHFTQTLQQRYEVAALHYITPSDGFQLLKEKLQLSDIPNQLSDNPLPGVIELSLNIQRLSLDQLSAFLTELKALPEVIEVQFDLEHIKNAYMKHSFLQRILCYGSIFFASVGIVLMTSHLLLTSYHSLIALFYTGISYGLLGGLLASILFSYKLYPLLEWLHLIEVNDITHWYLPITSTLIGFSAALCAALIGGTPEESI